MSTIRKTPYIETLVSGLSAENKATLLGIVNGSGSNVAASVNNLPDDDVKAVNFEFPDGKLKSALYVKTASHTALLCYNRFQDLLILEIDSNNNINKIDEYCDIEELRTILNGSVDTGANARAVIDPDDDDVVIYNEGLQVDNNGDVTVAKDLFVEDEIVLDGISKIVDTDGNAIIPDSEAGKVLVGGSDFVYHLNTTAQMLQAPASGTYTLKSVDGVLTWVADE